MLQTRRELLIQGVVGVAFWSVGASARAASPADGKNAVETLTRPDFNMKLLRKRNRYADSYTQGLVFEVDSTGRRVLYESGGRYGRSLLRKVDADTGDVLREVKVPARYFAEGIAVVGDNVYMLTWRERRCFVYEKESFKKIDEFAYAGEGWGLAYDGNFLFMSDGTSKIRVLDPKSFKQKKSFNVYFKGQSGKRSSLYNINELEFVDGELWANVYQQDYIVRIDPETGEVIKAINFASLKPENLRGDEDYVLNGLAFDAATRTLFVTGKCWPVIYEITLTQKNIQ
ncbi:MAG: glutaminyl-peptide cyclotransferase [Thermoguttaceae bacterium]|nr:glutaminyl-peptide cyclotransferase [Thermoguttaceae bacterium]